MMLRWLACACLLALVLVSAKNLKERDGPDCQDNCNDQGVCVKGHCKCNSGFRGAYCELSSDLPLCSNECSGNGECVSDNVCKCNDNYTGADCSKTICPNDCSNHGECDLFSKSCTCDIGWTGEDCLSIVCPNNCNNNGKCTIEGTCECKDDFSGVDCSKAACPLDCSNKGKCQLDSENGGNKCFCEDGHSGVDCSVCDSNIFCNGNGACIVHGSNIIGLSENICVCDSMHTGKYCDISVCPSKKNNSPHCSGHGTCSPDTLLCTCEKSWSGSDCSRNESASIQNTIDEINACLSNPETGVECNGNGACVNGECYCLNGWSNPGCGSPMCLDNCNGNGICSEGVCVCNSGFHGASCSELGEAPSSTDASPENCRKSVPNYVCGGNCSGHGTCDLINSVCNCDLPFFGATCAQKKCLNDCSRNGVCNFENGICTCLNGYAGESCESSANLFHLQKLGRMLRRTIAPLSKRFFATTKPVVVYGGPDAQNVHRSNAEKLIAEVPVIKIDSATAICDGGGGALGHPVVTISLRRAVDDYPVMNCHWCGLRYQYDDKHHH